jgi:putative peptidoglycan lipid II flippase
MCSDAFLVALRIANTFRRIFAEGAFNAAFLPRFSKVLNRNGKKEANVVFSELFSLLILVLIGFCVIVLIFFPSVLKILVSGFDVLSKKFELTVTLGRICFPYLIFISITSLFCGVLNTLNKFALPAGIYSLLSVFTSIGLLIGYFLDLSHYTTVHIVAASVLLSGIIQSYLLFRSARRHGFAVLFIFHCWSPRVKDIMKNMIPGIIGAGVWQLNLLMDTAISSHLPTGTITCLNLADRINQFPLGTLGIALSTALLPVLSKFASANKHAEASVELEKGLLFAFFLTFYATSVLMALSEPTISVAFQRGMFGEEQVKVASVAVVGFAIGLPAYVLSKVFSTVYFATGDTTSPVIFGIFSVIANAMFLIILVPFLKYFGVALATSLAAVSNATALVYFSQKKFPTNFSGSFKWKIFSQFAAAVVTYLSLQKLAFMYWNCDMGTKSIKWVIYFGFLAISIFIFFSITIVCLRFTNQKKWKLWQKESWN